MCESAGIETDSEDKTTNCQLAEAFQRNKDGEAKEALAKINDAAASFRIQCIIRYVKRNFRFGHIDGSTLVH